uniref:Movement protein n=1 Tax=Cherry-associated luteovirus TaxID=1912598 RepID=A0A5B8PCM4_9TOMB|nr:movement protein [Cherry-associated luteovirus]
MEGIAPPQWPNQLWSTYNLAEEEEPVEAMQEETEYLIPDQGIASTGSLLQWTTSRPTIPGQSSSDPLFHSTQIFQMAYSSPSTSIRSRILRSSSSRTRPAPLAGHSLLRLTLPASNPIFGLESSPSQSQKALPEVSSPRSSEDLSGTRLRRISSSSSTKEMGRQKSRGSSIFRSP